MSISTAQTVWTIVAIYCVAGLVFAVFFAWRGAVRLDPRAAGASRPFRLIIIPATVALWPLLAWLWIRSPTTTGTGSAIAGESRR